MKDFQKFLKEYLRDEEKDEIDILIDSNDIKLDKRMVESIISLINKTLNDWNREKSLIGSEIEKVVIGAIKSELINVS